VFGVGGAVAFSALARVKGLVRLFWMLKLRESGACCAIMAAMPVNTEVS